MVTLTQSLEHWLWVNYRELVPLIMLGHIELFTEETGFVNRIEKKLKNI